MGFYRIRRCLLYNSKKRDVYMQVDYYQHLFELYYMNVIGVEGTRSDSDSAFSWRTLTSGKDVRDIYDAFNGADIIIFDPCNQGQINFMKNIVEAITNEFLKYKLQEEEDE